MLFFFFCPLPEKLQLPQNNQVPGALTHFSPALGRLALAVMGHKPALYPLFPAALPVCTHTHTHPQPATGGVLPQKAQLGAAHVLEEPLGAEHLPFPIRWFVPVSLAHGFRALTRALPCLLLPCCPRHFALLGLSSTTKGKGAVIRRCNSLLVWAGRKLPLSQRGK